MSDTVYSWGQAPENLKTRAQLAEIGLRPGGPAVARVEWGRGRWVKYALLYDEAVAVAKKPATAAQLSALEKARVKRESCPHCGTHLGFVPWKRFSWRDCPACLSRHIARAHADAVMLAREALANPRAVILDTETTGLERAYAVQIAVIGMDGGVRFDRLLNPRAEITEGAQQVHGVTEEMVRGAPTFADIEEELRAVLEGAQVWAYNAPFDQGVIYREVYRVHPGDDYAAAVRRFPDVPDWKCAMKIYSEWYGEWESHHNFYFRWQKLPGGDHSALGDCRATLALFKKMAADDSEDESHEQ